MQVSQNLTQLFTTTANDQVVRPRNITKITGLSRTQIWRLGKDPDSGFPKKIQLSTAAVGWRLSEIIAWLESRKAA
jgi:prophage regulatory protein